MAQHKEDRKVHPIQYASRTMTSAERKYSACERGALAVIFALKKFRVYLLSTQRLTLITDHQALQYGFNKKYIHGRLAKIDFLAEYEFGIKYRPGGKKGTADFLSRLKAEDEDGIDSHDERDLVCSVSDPQEAQPDWEPHLIDISRYLRGIEMTEVDAPRRRPNRQSAKSSMACNGQLFRRTNNGLRVILPIEARRRINRAVHDEIGH